MIVLDASATVDLLLRTPQAGFVDEQLLSGRPLHAPAVLEGEVLGALRRKRRHHELEEARAIEALEDLARLPLHLHDLRPLLQSAWRLHHNFSAMDALYIALAAALDAELLTTDLKAGRAAAELTKIGVLMP